MDKKTLFMICVCGLVGVLLVTNMMPNSMYDISDDPSTYEAAPLEGVTLSLEADYQEAFLTIQNESGKEIHWDFTDQPPAVEVTMLDSWRPLITSVKCSLAPAGIGAEGGSATVSFRWKEHLLGGLLSTGDYRIIVSYEADGVTYRDDVEFHVK